MAITAPAATACTTFASIMTARTWSKLGNNRTRPEADTIRLNITTPIQNQSFSPALNLPAGGRAVALDAAAPLVERSDHDRDRGDQPAGDWRDPAVLQLPPRLPVGLDQNARLTAFDRGVLLLPGAHVAPDRRVVVGLRLRP